MATSEQFMPELLKLPARERARIARVLLESLDEGGANPDVDKDWAEEIARRVKSINDGTAEIHDWNEVRERVRTRLRMMRNAR